MDCDYPESLIDKGFHRDKIQGPAPEKRKTDVIPFVTTNYCNLDFRNFVENANNLLKSTKDDKLKKVFKDRKVILSLKQPKSLIRILMPTTINHNQASGIFKCQRPNCKICRMYLQEVSSFVCSNGFRWDIKCRITCQSKFTLYYLVCNMCNIVTYTGRTIDLRDRTNNHIDCCRHGKGTDKFDLHAYECGIKNDNLREPFFKMYAFMTFNSESKLNLYERMLHNKKLDTMNS